MSTVPFLPESAPFTPAQRAWLNGFFAGLCSRAPAAAPASTTPAPRPLAPLTILFGSQTGTAETLAKRAAKEAGKRSFAATVLDMAQTDVAKLTGEKNLLIITSTHGDGEPPDNAKSLHAALRAGTVPPLKDMRFSVCALGDRNYAQFCRCGQDFDAYLEKCGATRVAPRMDCDVEYDEAYTKWLDAVLSALGSAATAYSPSVALPPALPVANVEAPTSYSRKNPFHAPLLAVHRLSGPGSAKEVNHIELSLADSGLGYEVGDALGVYAHNCPELVAAVLAALQCDGEEAVPTPEGDLPLRAALAKFYDLGKPTPELLAMFSAATAPAGAPDAALPAASMNDVLDVLHANAGHAPAPGEFVGALRKLQPRLYSISSAPAAHLGQVHLTVSAVRYELDGRARKGLCSTFLAERAQSHGRVGVYVHPNTAFKLPADPARPIIMVGPGTGIAPFRAFLHERRAAAAKGRHWLFFGDQHAAHDFLYREELESFWRDGFLYRLDTAFSRDQAQKVYVQHRLLEQSREIFRWLEDGAHFYVCGDATRMAKDVDEALRQIIAREGSLTSDAAGAYLDRLRAEKRYARDVY